MVIADRQSGVSLISAALELMSAALELMSAAPEAAGDSASNSSGKEAAGWQAEPSSENESNTESDHAEASRVRLRVVW